MATKDKPCIVVDTRDPLHTAYRFNYALPPETDLLDYPSDTAALASPHYRFDPLRVDTVRKKLDSADYSVVGFENAWGVERKTLDDFVGTVIRARGRFEAELERLVAFKIARIVVEGSLEDVVLHHYRAPGVHPNSILGSAWAIEADFGIPIVWAGDREHAELYTQGLLCRLWMNAQKDNRQGELAFSVERPATGE